MGQVYRVLYCKEHNLVNQCQCMDRIDIGWYELNIGESNDNKDE